MHILCLCPPELSLVELLGLLEDLVCIWSVKPRAWVHLTYIGLLSFLWSEPELGCLHIDSG